MKRLLLIAGLLPVVVLSSYSQEPQFIFPLQEEHVHASSLVSLPNGDLLAAWFQGGGERTADDARIMGARKQAGSDTWSEPFLLADTPFIPDCNPVLFLNGRGKLFLIWIAVQANAWESSVLRIRTSSDFVQTGAPRWAWQDNLFLKPDEDFLKEVKERFAELPDAGHGWAEYAAPYEKQILEAAADPRKRSFGWMTRIKPLILPDGKIVLPLYSDGFNFSLMAISEDDGETWKPGLPLVGKGPIQPALALRSDGTLLALMRDSGDSPSRVHRSRSSDGGYRWKLSQKTDLPNTASVELLRLQDGRMLFLGNDVDDGRYRLSFYVSNDEGENWGKRHVLEDHPKIKNQGFSYPSLIQSADGLIHLSYSYHHSEKSKTIAYRVIRPENL